MPGKPTKYGINVQTCAHSATGYVLNNEVYLYIGKDKDNMDGVDLHALGLGHHVVA